MIPLRFDYKRKPKPKEDRNRLTGCGLDLGPPLYWAISQDGEGGFLYLLVGLQLPSPFSL